MKPGNQRLRIYDTLSRQIQEVAPSDGARLRFYCCGPTVYGPAHIGNFRTFVLQDVFRRTLELSGQPTQHVRNITNVDDKTIRESQAQGKSLQEFTNYWEGLFHKDCEALNMLPPHIEPEAVEHIPDQIRLIESLVEKGHAYRAEDGSVYFKVQSLDSYGALSRVKERELTPQEESSAHNKKQEKAGPVSDDEYAAESMADFALWKAQKPEDGPNHWESPWGPGRPGWHIECSAMGMRYLGESFDLHSGGIDLIFPHHENEIAQSEAVTCKPFARLWFHIAHLMVDGGKMSKSLGNLYTLDDLKERGFTANELRYALGQGHYRQPLNFTFASLTAARQALLRLGKMEAKLRNRLGEEPAPSLDTLAPGAIEDFHAPELLHPAWSALLNDLNTPDALGKMFTAIKEMERSLESANEDQVREWRRGLWIVWHALGIHPVEPKKEDTSEAPEEVQALAQSRWEAKQAKDWAKADVLRAEIQAAGWLVKDRKDGFDLTPSE